MDSAVAVHTYGLGSWLWALMYSWIEGTRSGTEWKTPRRNALSVSSLNQRSTRLSHDDEVGVKWRWNRGCLSSQLRTSSCWWVGELSRIRWICRSLGTCRSMVLRNFNHSLCACRGVHGLMFMPVSTSSAANRVVVPWRL